MSIFSDFVIKVWCVLCCGVKILVYFGDSCVKEILSFCVLGKNLLFRDRCAVEMACLPKQKSKQINRLKTLD